MRGKRNTRLWSGRVALVALGLGVMVALGFCGPTAPAWADDKSDAEQLVDKARVTLEAFVGDKEMGPALKALLQKAKGVLIYPQVLRGAFVFGVSGGSGTLVAHDAQTMKWGGPAFYTIGETSFGLQAGGDASEVVLVALTERGMTSFLATSAKLGADVGVAARAGRRGGRGRDRQPQCGHRQLRASQGTLRGHVGRGGSRGDSGLSQQGLLRPGGQPDGHPGPTDRQQSAGGGIDRCRDQGRREVADQWWVWTWGGGDSCARFDRTRDLRDYLRRRLCGVCGDGDPLSPSGRPSVIVGGDPGHTGPDVEPPGDSIRRASGFGDGCLSRWG